MWWRSDKGEGGHLDYWLLVCRLKYDVIKERKRFLGSLIIDDDVGRICIGFWRWTDTEWGVRKDMLRSDNEEFDVGCRFRDEDGFKMAIVLEYMAFDY